MAVDTIQLLDAGTLSAQCVYKNERGIEQIGLDRPIGRDARISRSSELAGSD